MTHTGDHEDYEGYAFDYSAEFEADLYTRPDDPAGVFEAPVDNEDGWAHPVPQSGVNVSRFRHAALAVKRMRAAGYSARDIMMALGVRDRAAMRRLENVLDWLEVAAYDPGAAGLARLSKRTFLTVVGHGILTVDELAARVGEFSRLPHMEPSTLVEIRSLVDTVSMPSGWP